MFEAAPPQLSPHQGGPACPAVSHQSRLSSENSDALGRATRAAANLGARTQTKQNRLDRNARQCRPAELTAATASARATLTCRPERCRLATYTRVKADARAQQNVAVATDATRTPFSDRRPLVRRGGRASRVCPSAWKPVVGGRHAVRALSDPITSRIKSLASGLAPD
jgi:hypothetical protein